MGRVGRMMRAVDADADRNCGHSRLRGLRLDQDADKLRAINQNVVRPLELYPQPRRDATDRIVHCQCRNETQFGCLAGRHRIGEQKAGVVDGSLDVARGSLPCHLQGVFAMADA